MSGVLIPRTAQNTRSGAVTTATLATQVADHIGGYLKSNLGKPW